LRNKSEAATPYPALPPSYKWTIVNDQPQVWHRGCVTFWVNGFNTATMTAEKAWRRWELESGLTRERYLDLLNYEDRCHNGEECQACVDREENEISAALEEALW